ncbi:antibiotic biosynthesis monooxygenase family protein [Mycolicibacterium austroafricanum]|uniref:antibiotic biosynthesis monooxygenase family protein n=1 Tax=Mycolicibacterium austroafricanum TaxID=39687 RepID=UPI001CA3804A|nr:antibiotic biosynthesis monooxygenase family protein [Mycolicibacterium austroafricanum]QZT64103.1 antibiotic biosynthesis monooxygenase [Mycolicibacterium austroafricanum]
MSRIEHNSPYATLVNVFTVEPDRAQQLVELLGKATEEVMQHLPGFRSANIHLSSDRTRVLNYAQWDSAAAFFDMQKNPAAREHMSAAAALAVSFDPHLYTVESVHQH